MNNIEACGNCGNPVDGDEVLMSRYKYYVSCYDCGFSGALRDTFLEAVREWDNLMKSFFNQQVGVHNEPSNECGKDPNNE